MKLKKIIISIVIIIELININSICFAKYVYECNKKAAEISINN